MPINENPGRIVGANLTPQTYGASGEWSLNQQFQSAGAGTWPLQPLAISRSLRFNSADSAYLNRTPASAGNRQMFTLSFWVKSGSLAAGTTGQILGTTVGTYDRINFGESSTAQLSFTVNAAGTAKQCFTPGVYRDPSAWYHFVVAVDTTQATAANRVKIYANGVQQTLTGTFPDQNYQSSINNNVAQYLGSDRGSTYLFSGYLTEINFIDGSQLDSSSFGFFDLNGIWQAKTYTGTYGTNGFYLTFADNSNTTAATLGKDYSGNGNNWTPNNFSVSAGDGNDSVIDSPTNDLVNTDTSAGVRGNYATLNSLDFAGSAPTNGNLTCAYTAGNINEARATMPLPTSGKFYWEVPFAGAGGSSLICGIIRNDKSLTNSGTFSNHCGAGRWTFEINNIGNYRFYNESTTATNMTGGSVPTGGTSVICFAYDATTRYLWCGYSVSGSGSITWYSSGDPVAGTNSLVTLPSGYDLFPLRGANDSTGNNINFGQQSFSLTVPSGYKALCSTNLPAPTIRNGAQYFAATTYTGNGATQTIVNNNNNSLTTFQPDLVWVKSRSAATDHKLTDSVRGATKGLISDTTGAETTDTNGLTAFGTTGFTLGTDTVYNNNLATYVAWQWKGGGTAVTNTSGTITSSVSANTTAGFSVVRFTPNVANGAAMTVGHGLGVTPSMIILKRTNSSDSWLVYHTSTGVNNYLSLNQTIASSAYAGWQGSLSSSLFMGLNAWQNGDTVIGYCFTPVAGYSAFGSYTGNGSTSNDGPFVYTGFRPRYIMGKRSDSTGGWWIFDTAINAFNLADNYLYAQLSDAEQADITTLNIDIVSNGFKIRSGTSPSTWVNANGGTYIYAAFAENPFAISRAR